MKALSENEIRALIQLLGDEDTRTLRVAWQALKGAGQQALQLLLEAREAPDPLVRGRVRLLLEDIRLSDLERRFAAYAAQPDADLSLEQGVFLLAEFAYPDVDVPACQAYLDEMAVAVRAELEPLGGPQAPMPAAIAAVNRELFERRGFYGNQTHYYDPDNSYFNRVLERRTGIPITLSALYLLVSGRAGLPVHGVGMPGHFIVRYQGNGESALIDPFYGGRLLSSADCARLLEQAGFSYHPAYLTATSVRNTMVRMVTNIVHIYTHTDQEARASRLARIIDILMDRRLPRAGDTAATGADAFVEGPE